MSCISSIDKLFIFTLLLFVTHCSEENTVNVRLTPTSSTNVQLHIDTVNAGTQAQAAHASPDAQSGGVGVLVPVKMPASYTEIFELTHYNVRCVQRGGPLFVEREGGLPKCKPKCVKSKFCGFVAVWSTGRCEGYSDCNYVSNLDEKNRPLQKVRLFTRMSECDLEVWFGIGRYVKLIASQFPGNVVRLDSPNRNIFCICLTGILAKCVVFVAPSTPEEEVVRRILDKANPTPPFARSTVMSPDTAPVVFSIPRQNTNVDVVAEIEALSPGNCIHLSFCTDGTPDNICPVTKKRFRAGEPVWILKSDIPALRKRSAVPCISETGIRHLSMVIHMQGDQLIHYHDFHDPLNRMPGQKLSAHRDYELFFVFDDKMIDTGICKDAEQYFSAFQEDEFEAEPLEPGPSSGSKKKKKKKKKSGARESDVTSDSGLSAPSSSSPFSPSPDIASLSLQEPQIRRSSSQAGPSSESMPNLPGSSMEGRSEEKVSAIGFTMSHNFFYILCFYIIFIFFTHWVRGFSQNDFYISFNESEC